MKTVFIYVLNDPVTGECHYLGKARHPDVRFRGHISRAKNLKTHRDAWIACLLKAGLRPVLEIIDEVLESQWEFWEREYIRVFRAIGVPLTNHTDGGEAGPDITGLKRPESFCAARRGPGNPNFGKPMSQEQKDRISETKKAKIRSGEIVYLRGSEHPQFGIKRSEEEKDKIRATSLVRTRAPGYIHPRTKKV